MMAWRPMGARSKGTVESTPQHAVSAVLAAAALTHASKCHIRCLLVEAARFDPCARMSGTASFEMEVVAAHARGVPKLVQDRKERCQARLRRRFEQGMESILDWSVQ